MFLGLVGKPSAGKSTLFKALTLMDVAIANYPFTTIKPNEGVAFARVQCVDKELGTQCNPRVGYCVEHTRFVPVKVLDVAGLVPGAHEGKGLGLEFLNDLSQADCLIHVIDISGSLNEHGEPVERGSHDPAQDVLFLERELDELYFSIFQKVWKRFAFAVKQTHEDAVKAVARQFSGLRVTEDLVKEKLAALGLAEKPLVDWSETELRTLTSALRRATKPILVAANKIDIPGGKERLAALRTRFPDLAVVPCSAEAELALKEAARHGLISYIPGGRDFTIPAESKLNEKQRAALEFIRSSVLQEFGSTGVQQVVDASVFELLRYVAVFPGGVGKLEDSEGRRLPDCFLMPPGTTALQFAFHLHTDLGENFIRAINVKTKLAMRKDALLQHRDVIEIVHG